MHTSNGVNSVFTTERFWSHILGRERIRTSFLTPVALVYLAGNRYLGIGHLL